MNSMRDPQRAPAHPGAILLHDVLPALKLTQTEFARRLSVSRLSVSELLHAKRSMTPEMAAKLAKLLRGSAEMWMRLQAAHDLWQVAQRQPDVTAAVHPLDRKILEAA